MTTAVAWIAPICALVGIVTAGYLGSWVIKQDPGPDKMHNISKKIQQGAAAFLAAEYKVLGIFVVVVAVVMALALSWQTAAAFVTGAVLSAAAGYAGMFVAPVQCFRLPPVTRACSLLRALTRVPRMLPRNRSPARLT